MIFQHILPKETVILENQIRKTFFKFLMIFSLRHVK